MSNLLHVKKVSSLALLATLLLALAAVAGQPCCWIDAKTGEQVGSVPAAALIRDEDGSAEVHSTDKFSRTAFNRRTKQNYVRVPCPRPGKTQPRPTPSTTDKVTDVLKTIGSSVSIDIG